MAAATQFVSIQPYFDVEEGKLEEFKAIWAGVTPKVKAETGCLYYGFTYNGNIAFCREGYSDAAAVLVHLGTVNEALGQVSDPQQNRHWLLVQYPPTLFTEALGMSCEKDRTTRLPHIITSLSTSHDAGSHHFEAHSDRGCGPCVRVGAAEGAPRSHAGRLVRGRTGPSPVIARIPHSSPTSPKLFDCLEWALFQNFSCS